MTAAGETPPALPPAPHGLSTMWAVQPRFEADMPAFLAKAEQLGFRAIEINHSMSARQIEAILDAAVLPVTSIHAPAPLTRVGGIENRELNLAAIDQDERSLALEHHERTIAVAADAGVGLVVVHLGQVGDRATPAARWLRDRYDRRERFAKQWASKVTEAQRERAEAAPPYLEAAARSLAALVEYAERARVTLGLESRLSYHQFPLPDEAVGLLAPYPPERAGYWHDVGHGEVLHRLGLVPLEAWFELLADRLVGVHLHDVIGLRDHRAPGTGDVDFEWLMRRIPPHIPHTYEIDEGERDADLTRAIDVVRGAG